jgi:spermidine/putrescine transport system substrate-binding protein
MTIIRKPMLPNALALSRRRFLQAGTAVAAAGALAGLPRRARAADEINALVWCDHTDPLLLEPFTEATGITVNTNL